MVTLLSYNFDNFMTPENIYPVFSIYFLFLPFSLFCPFFRPDFTQLSLTEASAFHLPTVPIALAWPYHYDALPGIPALCFQVGTSSHT